MLHCRYGIGLVMSSAWFPPNMTAWHSCQRVQSLSHQTREFCFSWSESFRCILANSTAMCLLLRSGFRLATLPYRPDWWIAAEMVVLLEGSPLSTEERWSSDRVTIRFLVTSLTKALLPRSLSLDSRPALGRVLVVPNFPFTDDGGHCAHWDLQSSRIFSVPFPRFVPQDNPVSEVYRQFL